MISKPLPRAVLPQSLPGASDEPNAVDTEAASPEPSGVDVEASPGTVITEGSGAQTPSTDLAGGGLSAGSELCVWNPQIALFRRDPRLLANNLVIGPTAPVDVSSAYNFIRTQILNRLRRHGWNTVAVTSPLRRSGATLTAINLAISLSRDFSHSVLLVELNLVNPSFHRILGLEPRPGVVDYLLHDAPLSEIVFGIGIERLAIIPAGSRAANSSELLSSPKMARLVERLKRQSERQVVLFDLPPALAVDDAMAFAPLADCVLLVVEEGRTGVNDVRRAINYLASTKMLGIVLNRSIRRENGGGTGSG